MKNKQINKLLSLALCLGALVLPVSGQGADLPVRDTRAGAHDLAQIYDLAASNDPRIIQARAQYNASHTLLAQGRSQLLPTVSLAGRSSRNTQAPTAEHSFDAGFNAHSYGLSLNQNLVNFQAWYAFQSAKQADRQALASLASAEQDLILRVATAYFNVLRSLDNLAAFEAEEEAALQVLEQTRQRFDVGLSAITDVNDSQAGYDLAQVNRLVEENNLNQRFEALSAITGMPHQGVEQLRADFPIVSPEPASLEEWVALAQENNLAIQAAEYELAARENDAKAARSAMLPRLSMSANYNDSAESANPFSFFPGTPNTSSSIQLNLEIPLFAGGLNQARKRQAYYIRDATEGALLETQRSSIQAARNSYRSVQTDVLAVRARQQAIVSAQSALESAEVGAEVGTRNVVDVVLAQRLLFQAMRDHANARYDYVIDTLNLKQAAGTLNPQDVIDLNEWLQ